MKKMILAAVAALITLAWVAFTPAKDNSVTIVVTHEVKDFATWKKSFDAHADARAKGGFIVQGVFTSIDNPNMVTVISTAPSAEAAKAFATNPELKASMEKAGVISRPDFRILNRAE